MTTLHELRDVLDDALQSSVPAELKAKGWRYQDFNTKFTHEAWDFLLRLMGEGEYQIICLSSGERKGEEWIRGQFWISPQGYTNMQDKDRREALRFGEPN